MILLEVTALLSTSAELCTHVVYQDLKHHFYSSTYHDVAVFAYNLNGIVALIYSFVQCQPKAAIGQNTGHNRHTKSTEEFSHLSLSKYSFTVLYHFQFPQEPIASALLTSKKLQNTEQK